MKWVLNISRHDFCTIQRKIGDFRLHFCKIDPKIVKISRLGPKFDLTRLKSTWQKFDLTRLDSTDFEHYSAHGFKYFHAKKQIQLIKKCLHKLNTHR